ncbi:MAG: NAD(P)/FAD-dependent oxidoreductase, partial [Eubacterium sp.]|nr:NAD(P)/FAD-dependent oxidoreductase [Candidatus Colimonas fimequi]
MYEIIIIGGGAAGLFSAAVSDKKISGLIIEKKDRVGRKLLMSGSGQCNITHGGDIKDFINHYGANGKRIRKLLYGANNSQLVSFIESLGVPTFEREDGKVFPVSLSAEDVRSVLASRAVDNGFEIVRNES